MRKRARIEIIDIAKAITIFLVIMGHTVDNFDTSLFRKIIYSFHMPLFFYLAGLSLKPRALKNKDEWLSFVRKNILALVFPYFIWGLVFGPFSFENILRLLYGSWNKIADAKTLTSLWYLPCLFIARIYVQILIDLFENKKNKTAAYLCFIVIFTAIGILLPRPETGYPWCMETSFVAAAFILMGIITRRSLIIFSQQKLSVLFLSLLAVLLVFYMGTVHRSEDLHLILLCRSDYGNVFWFVIDSVCGSLAVMTISMIIAQVSRESSRPFSTSLIRYIGTHTMGIFLLHKNILQELVVPWIASFVQNPTLRAFVSSVIVMPVVLVLCVVIERYIPQLLGQFPPYEHNEK